MVLMVAKSAVVEQPQMILKVKVELRSRGVEIDPRRLDRKFLKMASQSVALKSRKVLLIDARSGVSEHSYYSQ